MRLNGIQNLALTIFFTKPEKEKRENLVLYYMFLFSLYQSNKI